MKINEERVPHYKLKKVPINEILKKVSINRDHLKEKNTWYMINGKLCFFKPRNDYRILGELISSDIQSSLGMDPVIYELAYINNELGLVCENFQTPSNGYYHAMDLYRPSISSIKSWGPYSFKSLYDYFEVKIKDPALLEKIRTQLAELFICDYLTHQEDRNYNNIIFQMKVNGITHELGKIPSIHGKDIIDISLAKIFDNEKCFSIGRDGVYDYNLNKEWDSAFLATPDTQKGFYEDGIDKNLFDFYCEYTDLSKPFMEKIVDEFDSKKILEKFQQGNSQVIIKPKNVSYIDSLLTNRQEGIFKILNM